jgi:hypothetical protein
MKQKIINYIRAGYPAPSPARSKTHALDRSLSENRPFRCGRQGFDAQAPAAQHIPTDCPAHPHPTSPGQKQHRAARALLSGGVGEVQGDRNGQSRV